MSINLKVIVVTDDNEYYKFVIDEMTKDEIYKEIVKVSTPLFAEKKLDLVIKNLILIDTDSVAISENDLSNIINRHNTIIIIVSSNRSTESMKFIRMGVNNFILKPDLDSNYSKENYLSMIRFKLKKFHEADDKKNVLNFHEQIYVEQTHKTKNDFALNFSNSQKIIAIASSTGGTEALYTILKELPLDCPPILVVQHMPTGFTKPFADRLNNFCKPEIREAKDNDILKKGLVLLAPPDKHMVIKKNASDVLSVKCFEGNRVHGVMPSADVLFESIANIMKDRSVGVVLTGMGADGGKGLKMMRDNGAKTIGQNKETCVVYGMPKVAFELGAVDVELPICDICKKMLQYVL